MAPSRDSTGAKRKNGSSSLAPQEAEGPASKRRKLPDSEDDPVYHATKTGHALVERLRRARDKKDWAVATHFLTLPDPEIVPDYYEQTGLPIALDTIEEKLERRVYVDTSAVESDFKRMIANAKTYNEKTSQIYADAEKIRKIVSVFMERENPAYKTGNYQPTATPLPDQGHEPKQEPTAEKENIDEETAGAPSKRRSGRLPASSPPKEERRASSTPAVKDAEGAGESFEGDTYQQAQEKIITEMMNLTDDDNNLLSANFLNLPSRSLQDYYRVIKHPVSLKSLAKLVQGIRGRREPAPVPPTSLFKSWDSFENEVSYIWRNAAEYNEDGSVIVELAEELREYFERRLAEAKEHVTEPTQPKVKLTLKPAQEPPKITLKFGQRQNPSAGVSVDQEALARQQNLVAGATNGQVVNGASQAPNRSQVTASLPAGQSSNERLSTASGEQGVNGVKREASHGHSPALGKVQPNGIGAAGTLTMPPPLSHAHNYGSPNLAAANVAPYNVTSHHSVPKNPSFNRAEGKTASDAIITNLNICTHPDLRDLPQKFNLDIPASDQKTQQSITISLSRRQWRLLIRPTLSASLLHRPSRTFVTCNGRRIQALAQPELDQRRPIFEHKLVPGTNTIELEVIAGMPRGAPKTGTGPEIEIEKFIVFAHYQM